MTSISLVKFSQAASDRDLCAKKFHKKGKYETTLRYILLGATLYKQYLWMRIVTTPTVVAPTAVCTLWFNIDDLQFL